MLATVSWTRAYHTRESIDPGRALSVLSNAGLAQPIDDHEVAFFDLQVLNSGQFRSAFGPPLTMAFDGDEPLSLRTHLLVHSSGFVVLRITLSGSDHPVVNQFTVNDFAFLERLPWNGAEVRWGFGGHQVSGNVRVALNAWFLSIHEVLAGRVPVAADIVREASDGPRGNDRIHRLVDRDEMSHPLPVSFGTHFEFADSCFANHESRMEFIEGVLRRSGVDTGYESALVDPKAGFPWYFFENQSLLFVPDPEPITQDGMICADAARLLDVHNLRRGALRSLQRDTQRVLAGGLEVKRRRIDEWRLLVATTTDDYVLHDRIHVLQVPLNRHLGSGATTRDPDLLETQVRANIDAFQARLDLAEQSVSTLIGAMFAVVAGVVGVGSLLKTMAASGYRTTVSSLPDAHPWISVFIDTAVTGVAFLGTLVVMKYVSSRVPAITPFRSRRRMRRRHPNLRG